MSLKLKMILGVLVLGAVFLGYRTMTGIVPDTEKTALTARNSLSARIGANITADSDLDGLNDDDETEYKTDYRDADSDDDGYLDGEEVVSGYDPNKDGDDRLKGTKNLTQLFVKNLIAGIMSGDLDPNKRGTDAYELGRGLLSFAVLDEAGGVLASDPTSEKLLVVPATDESLQDYAAALQGIISDPKFQDAYNNQPDEIYRAFDLMKQGKQAQGLAILYHYQSMFEDKMRQMAGTPVPEMFAESHRIISSRLSELANAYGALAKSQQADNPDLLLRNIALKRISDTITALQSDLIAQFQIMLEAKKR